MLRNRLFNVFITTALALVVALAAREAFARTGITFQSDGVTACASLPSRYSIRTEYVDGTGWVTYTEDGPTGLDGGLIDLLSKYRTCSK